MVEWLAANWVNIIILAVVGGLIALAVIVMIKDKKAGKSSCGCNCANWAMAGKCHSQTKANKS